MELSEVAFENVEALANESAKTLRNRLERYAKESDPYQNFEAVGRWLGIDPVTVAFFYMAKHLDAIRKWALNPTEQEPPLDSFVDVYGYLAIMVGLNEKRKEGKNA